MWYCIVENVLLLAVSAVGNLLFFLTISVVVKDFVILGGSCGYVEIVSSIIDVLLIVEFIIVPALILGFRNRPRRSRPFVQA